MNRKQNLVVGRWVWVEHCTQFELPAGIVNGASMKVVAHDSQTNTATVEIAGRTWEIDPIHLDTGWTFLLGGKYFDEHTQRAKAHIRKIIAELRRNPHPRFPELSQERAAEWMVVLSRNEPPAAMAA